MDPVPSKHNSRLGTQEREGFSRMEAVPASVPSNLSEMGSSRDRPVRIQSIASIKTILQLESRSRLSSSRCLPSGLGKFFPYTFPPFWLIKRVLEQVERQGVERMILITPLWPTQSWYPLVMDMAVETPILLPHHQRLLLNPQKEIHPLLKDTSLNLVAWLVSGTSSRRRGFQKRLQTLSLNPRREGATKN